MEKICVSSVERTLKLMKLIYSNKLGKITEWHQDYVVVQNGKYHLVFQVKPYIGGWFLNCSKEISIGWDRLVFLDLLVENKYERDLKEFAEKYDIATW